MSTDDDFEAELSLITKAVSANYGGINKVYGRTDFHQIMIASGFSRQALRHFWELTVDADPIRVKAMLERVVYLERQSGGLREELSRLQVATERDD